MTPTFEILMDGIDITGRIKKRVLSITVNDEAGSKSDTVRIELDDRGNSIVEPPDGTLILVALGYEEFFPVPMGVFVLDKVEYEIAPDRMIIHGKAAHFGSSLKDQKTRNWDGKTNGEIVAEIAAEHKLEPKVAERLKSIKHEYLAQRAESDINFLARIGQEHDAIVSVKEGGLLFIGKGEGKSASGTVLPQTWVFKSQLMPGSRVSKDKATAYKSVKAIWHDKKVGEKKTVTEGKGSPSYEMTHPYRTEEAAQRAAKSKLDEQARAGHSISLTLVGNPILRAEGQALVVGLRPSIPPLWSITGVTHRLGSGGYTTQIRGELPKNEG
ncbi:late control protein D [Phaeobacter inhibens]|uniref:phage late control D family protein n=1 Tax=Phaeobacter inhibens TaxID=221822 RepID=UPI00276C33DC|nr:contractile injection system protein, VgrG/Pvc8 family [Phaeobacter inhibens]GLO70622.1 late control protein D [Phaeobacter inhibens]GLO70931.1 late control protein D [Phaeobacter inhibens]